MGIRPYEKMPPVWVAFLFVPFTSFLEIFVTEVVATLNQDELLIHRDNQYVRGLLHIRSHIRLFLR